MKRNFDLVRRIMTRIESVHPGSFTDETTYLQDLGSEYEPATIYAHIELLLEENFIKGKIHKNPDDIIDAFRITGLTWKGHDFIDAARDESIWSKAKDSVLKPTASFTFDILLEWLKAQARQTLGLP